MQKKSWSEKRKMEKKRQEKMTEMVAGKSTREALSKNTL